jgi:Effector Associated Constant Component 1
MSDIVKLVIDSEFQILHFGRAYVAWRATRGVASPLRVERDGVGVTLDDGDPEVVARVIRAIG